MRVKEAYYYLFYRLLRVWANFDNPLLSVKYRAELSLVVIKAWLIFSVFTFLDVIGNSSGSNTVLEFIVAFILVVGSTTYFFSISDKWKSYMEKFDQWPERKNVIGGIIVWSVGVLIFLCMILSVELFR